MQEVLMVAIRAAIAVAIMASASFVLGTVVAYQFHEKILRFDVHNNLESAYRSLVRNWYVGGTIFSGIVCIVIDHLRSEPFYLFILAMLVILSWTGWWAHARWTMRNEISESIVVWEFGMSCLSLGLLSAFTGVGMVDQIFQLAGWRQ